MSLKQFFEEAYRRQWAKWLYVASIFPGVKTCSMGESGGVLFNFLFEVLIQSLPSGWKAPFHPFIPSLPLFSLESLKCRARKHQRDSPLLESWRHPSVFSGKISSRVAFEVGFLSLAPPFSCPRMTSLRKSTFPLKEKQRVGGRVQC